MTRARMLEGYRALDLTDEKGFLCGKILAELGVDVIKVEKPGGDPSRETGPFWHNEKEPEKSLYWFAYNSSKRGITLDLETEEGNYQEEVIFCPTSQETTGLCVDEYINDQWLRRVVSLSLRRINASWPEAKTGIFMRTRVCSCGSILSV